eukprot:CAMPEP_0201285702 /NCGR_PEP_ID=MMETSP1317-20130820/113711_1 /ASSEMBLY_ACC=CAM_ASM_000770 /TAXON_ID=187299 /ORGANISM="Undescribed Undescribed, Strain Undescribed" /LENGTH=52 /DNA_ID=CAMNT_0047611507 /DNA_START=1122 /DNA_END=1280 /DNA_ORIENTATION=-
MQRPLVFLAFEEAHFRGPDTADGGVEVPFGLDELLEDAIAGLLAVVQEVREF